jgi:subtilase family serine protease
MRGPGVLGGALLGAAMAVAAAAPQEPLPDLTPSVATARPDWPNRRTVITVTVKNIGEGACPKSVCHVFIRHAHSPRETFKVVKKDIRPLDPHDRFVFSFPVEFGLGLFEIEAVADRAKKIPESDETNNNAKVTVAGQ